MRAKDFKSELAELQLEVPRLARALVIADELRERRLASYRGGSRFSGLETLLLTLDAMKEGFEGSKKLGPVAFLVGRSIADFETALEAILSGYQAVAMDAMRDVMEIEYLLLDFFKHPEHIDEWLHAERRDRLKQFSPGALRQRLIAAGVEPFAEEGWEPTDYWAHSEALHATPHESPIGAKGLERDPDSMFADAGFMEIFEHGRRLLIALVELLDANEVAASEYDVPPQEPFHDARARTGEMQVMMIGFLEAPRKLQTELGRPPTEGEVLEHVRDLVATQSPRRPADEAI